MRDEFQYFCPKTSSEILRVFKKESKNIDFITEREIRAVKKNKELFEIFTDKGSFFSKKVVVASGGLSYQSVGASGIG